MPKPGKSDRNLLLNVGLRLREVRERLGWTQERLAEQLGVQPETVSRYETGVIPLSIATLEQVSIVTGEPVQGFLVGSVNAGPQAAEEQELVSRWRAMDKEGRHLVLQLMRRLRVRS